MKNEKTHFFGYDIKDFFRKKSEKNNYRTSLHARVKEMTAKQPPERTESHGAGEEQARGYKYILRSIPLLKRI